MSINKIMLVGEAWGQEEEETGQPFVGPFGKLLNGMLAQVGIARNECYVTNVFNLRPQPKNDILNLTGPKGTALPGYPAIKAGKYIRAEYAGELARLYREIQHERPNLIVALGASAAWALLGTSGIKKIRGAPSFTAGKAAEVLGDLQVKVLPTYHPAAIMRDWSLRAITIMDLFKAVEEAGYPEIRRPKREIWIEPTLDDLAVFDRFIDESDSLSVDIETAGDQITCVGFAPSVDRAIVVPLVNPLQRDGNYWRSIEDELIALGFIRKWCGLAKRIVGQNFNYDMHRLWRSLGMPIPGAEDDTMLLHHALQPELDKGLGFLATIYTKELAWKFMRAKHETIKQED